MVVLPPQASVKVMADTYGINFWKLWWQVKKRITKSKTEFSNPPKEMEYKEMSTDLFFDICSEDRLYWWRKDGDVKLTEETCLGCADNAVLHIMMQRV